MEDIYSGNSIPITINAQYKDGSQYVFKPGDVVILGIKKHIGCTEYIYKKEIPISEAISTVNINIEPEATSELEGKYIIEAELRYNNGTDISTLFQEEFRVKGVVINE